MADKPILCVDFDGVLHNYKSGWKGADVIPDGPVPGAIQWLVQAAEHFSVHIYSSRTNQPGGVEAMQKWLTDQMMHIELQVRAPWDWEEKKDYYEQRSRKFVQCVLQWPTRKPAAFLTIDDRAIQFYGDFSVLEPESLLHFKPWNRW